MIRSLKRFVSWLESRFPERVTVTVEEYRRDSDNLTRALVVVAELDVRLATVESNSVHKDAVKDLIAVVESLKNDVEGMKHNLGWQQTSSKVEEIKAMLNGEVI